MKSSTVSAVLAGVMALGLLSGSAFGKSPAKPAAKKMAPVSFVCRHGCGKKITVKAAGDWQKTCPVCGCKKTNMQCKPEANKKP